jgi:hypothetical protein
MMQKPPSHRVAAAALAAVLTTAIAVLVAPSGMAATPCSEAVLADWLDNNRIDGLYELPCYEAAIDAIPDDLRDYTDAADVIARAFQDASGRKLETRAPQGRHANSPTQAVAPPVNASSPPWLLRCSRRVGSGSWLVVGTGPNKTTADRTRRQQPP